ncbi:hypothetical protein PTSG_11946 [Salpingoeca rosetta]|uniref:Transposase MuDR plant domain-containing protein n=1 Tax=Salpingoeca rosetta (strain ATCC 50818 / BSB-021) TaxID=946362 RepID=F2U3X2_SALR5|nr:uncharacterized protein PTSG_11946 [Salpingoeca rosetta]EGD82316.1 hypothetical protein PTSG_11946 [Salpingoeca rosetta]|eukprot:XP_004996499.1 hypothetical protein PTSG_11946 [Salpingoeca rosetta]
MEGLCLQQLPELYAGQLFNDLDEAKLVIEVFCFLKRRPFRVVNRNPNRMVIKCTNKKCPFAVRMSRTKAGVFRVSSLLLQHTCPSTDAQVQSATGKKASSRQVHSTAFLALVARDFYVQHATTEEDPSRKFIASTASATTGPAAV